MWQSAASSQASVNLAFRFHLNIVEPDESEVIRSSKRYPGNDVLDGFTSSNMDERLILAWHARLTPRGEGV